MSDGRQVVAGLWAAMNGRDWEALASLLSEDFECVFPQSGEVFDAAGWLALNRDYPGDWRLEVTRIVAEGAVVVSEARVEIDGRVDTALSFFTLDDVGRVRRLREFWPEPFEVPEWRQP